MLLAWLISTALGASQLVITTDRPVVVFVNLKPHPLQPGSAKLVIDFPDGKEGEQRVAVRTVLQELVWSGPIDVPADTKVYAEWLQRRMQVGAPQPLQKARMSDKGVYNVDGEWVRGQAGVAPPVLPAPAPKPKPVPVEDAFLDAVQDAGQVDGAGGALRSADVIVRPQAGQGEGVLRLANRSTSWSNVVVGDQEVAFRGERQRELTLPSGPHVLEVRDYVDVLKWRGTVWVWPDETVELQFSEGAAPKVPERVEAYEEGPLPSVDP